MCTCVSGEQRRTEGFGFGCGKRAWGEVEEKSKTAKTKLNRKQPTNRWYNSIIQKPSLSLCPLFIFTIKVYYWKIWHITHCSKFELSGGKTITTAWPIAFKQHVILNKINAKIVFVTIFNNVKILIACDDDMHMLLLSLLIICRPPYR